PPRVGPMTIISTSLSLPTTHCGAFSFRQRKFPLSQVCRHFAAIATEPQIRRVSSLPKLSGEMEPTFMLRTLLGPRFAEYASPTARPQHLPAIRAVLSVHHPSTVSDSVPASVNHAASGVTERTSTLRKAQRSVRSSSRRPKSRR